MGRGESNPCGFLRFLFFDLPTFRPCLPPLPVFPGCQLSGNLFALFFLQFYLSNSAQYRILQTQTSHINFIPESHLLVGCSCFHFTGISTKAFIRLSSVSGFTFKINSSFINFNP